MGGGLESRCVGRVYGADGAVRHGRSRCYGSCRNTDYVHINAHDRTIIVILAKHCIKLPDDGSLVIRNMLEQF
jgi:hypothetical protein